MGTNGEAEENQVRKSQIVERVAAAEGLSRTATAKVVDGVIGEIVQALVDGESVRIAGFGTFEARGRGARMARNPRTGGVVQVEAKRVPAFKAGKVFREAVAAGDGGVPS